jgi:hypothetical protein
VGAAPKRSFPLLPILAVVAVLIAGIGFFVASGGDDDDGGGTPSEIFLEPASSVGADPFTDSVATALSTTTTAAPTTTATTASTGAPSTPAVRAVQGTAPGLYGGTRNQQECNKDQLISFLEANPAKGQAWATVQGIQPSDIRSYISALAPVLLQKDTRVTNHGFKNGRATQHQSVLQAGTAVLVDNTGVPRARCACGNPLLPPQQATQKFTGTPWPGFDANAVQVIAAADPVPQLQVRDVNDGSRIDRPVQPFTPSATTTTTATGSSTTATTAASSGPNVASTGTGTASGSVGGSGPELALDGDPNTAWLSPADGSNPSLYIWETPNAVDLHDVTIVPIATAGQGFARVTMRMFTADGSELFNETKELVGSPDPTVTFKPGVKGGRIIFTFEGHENAAGSGFAELQIS